MRQSFVILMCLAVSGLFVVDHLAMAQVLPVAGHVFNGKGEPVSGATVTAIQSEQLKYVLRDVVGKATTDTAGAFAFELARKPDEQSHVYFIATHPDFGLTGTLSFFIQRTTGYGDVKLTLQKGAALAGKVTDAQGKPIKGALVLPTLQYGTTDGGQFHLPLCEAVLGVQTSEDGRYVIAGLPEGANVSLRASHPDYAMALAGLPDSAQPGQGGLLKPGSGDVDIVMNPGGSISGSVLLPDGNPAANVKVITLMTAKEPAARMKSVMFGRVDAVTDAEGKYVLPNLPEGAYGIQVEHPDFTAPVLEPVEVVSGAIAQGNDLRLSPGVLIAGKFVQEQTGQPVPEGRLRVQGGPGQISSHLSAQEIQAKSDGTFAFRQPPGDKPLNLYAFGGAAGFVPEGENRKEIKLEEGKDVTDLVFTVKPWLAFKGRVLGPDGKPLAGAEVKFMMGISQSAVSGEDGTFTLSPIRETPREYEALLLTATHPDMPGYRGLLSKPFQSEADAEGEIQLLQTGTVKGRVVNENDEPMPNAKVTLQQYFRHGNFGRVTRDKEVTSDDQGYYTLSDVPSEVSNWVVAKADGYGEARHQDVTVAGGETKELTELTLQPADLSLEGTVTNEDGEPVAGVNISINGQASGHQSVTSDEKGHYRIDNLVDEQIRLWAYHQTAEGSLRANLNVQAGETDADLVLSEESRAPQEEENIRLVDKEAPALAVATWVNGKAVDLASLKGKVVALAFQNVSHKKYAEFAETMRKLVNEYEPSGVEFIGIQGANEAVDEKALKQAVQQQGLKYRLAVDKEEDGKLATFNAYRARKVPAVYVIDKKGILRYQDVALPAVGEAIKILLGEG